MEERVEELAEGLCCGRQYSYCGVLWASATVARSVESLVGRSSCGLRLAGTTGTCEGVSYVPSRLPFRRGGFVCGGFARLWLRSSARGQWLGAVADGVTAALCGKLPPKPLFVGARAPSLPRPVGASASPNPGRL